MRIRLPSDSVAAQALRSFSSTDWQSDVLGILFVALLLACVAGPSHAACPTPSFVAPAAFPVGAHPYTLAVGDFNGDGKLDLAVANQYCDDTNQICNSVSILLGNGTGTLLPTSTVQVGSYPQSIAVGDFNGDSRLDLAVANSTDPGTVSVCLGNGNGTFQAAMTNATGVTPGCVVVGDFNEDNKLDLAVANYVLSSGSSVSVLIGKGDGTFFPRVNYSGGSYPESLAIGDFNEDHHLDLAVARSGAVGVMLGNGDGSFQSISPVASVAVAESVTVGDFNQDNHADIAVVNDTSPGTVVMMLGNGNGTFQSKSNLTTGTYPVSLESADYNGDGKPDFAVVDDTGVSVLLRMTNGTYQTTTGFNAGSGPYSLTTGLFNADMSPDLVIANYNSNGTVSVLLNGCVTTSTNEPVLIKSPARQGDGLFHFTITSQAGAVLIVSASTNLVQWTQIAVVTNVTGIMDFADPASASLPRRFYTIGLPGAVPQGMTIAGLTRLADGNIQFTVLGSVGQPFRVLSNTNLAGTNWVTMATLTNSTGNHPVTDTTATNAARKFYRTVSP